MKQAIFSYAPPHENDTESYLRSLEQFTGLSRDTKLKLATPEQMEELVQGIFRHEGTKTGTIRILRAISQKTGKYIWHTAKDEKVRATHASRDGKIFDYADPPEGGNPGENYNCRCWAEPLPEKALQSIFKK